jgi:hypothetical protein
MTQMAADKDACACLCLRPSCFAEILWKTNKSPSSWSAAKDLAVERFSGIRSFAALQDDNFEAFTEAWPSA